MAKIGIIGSATQDIFLLYEGADVLNLHMKKEKRSFLLFEQGTKIDIPDLYYASGGGAINTAVGFKRLGLDVAPIIKTGKNDTASEQVRNDLLKEGISTDHTIIDETSSTAISFIVPSIAQNQVAFCYRGANRNLIQEDVPPSLLSTLDYLFIGPLSGQSRALLPYLTTKARDLSIPVGTNPSIGQLTENIDVFLEALENIEILITNAFEATHLMKALMKQEAIEPAKKHTESKTKPQLLEHFATANGKALTIIDYFTIILNKGPSIVVVTNGVEGVYAATHDMLYFHSSLKTEVVGSLGAGDAFTTTFVGTLILGKDIETAIRYGIINATSVIKYLDAKMGLLKLQELEARAHKIDKDLLKRYPFD